MSSSKARKAADEADPETGTTPLIAAAKAGHCGCIELLIAKGASVNKTNKNGWTPLMAAARYGGRNSWSKVPSALFDDGAPSARLALPQAQAAPTHPGAPPPRPGRARRLQQLT